MKLVRVSHSCFEGEYAELMQSLDRHIELHFNESNGGDPGDLSSLILSQELGWRNILSRAALEETKDG